MVYSQIIDDNGGSSFMRINFDREEFRSYISSIGQPPYDLNILTIQNTTFTNISKIKSINDTIQYALYNTNNGILRIFSQGIIWDLKSN